MKKLINGIIDFQQHVRPDYRETFARLALGQFPDTLFIACSDSRVVPNLFASTDPGDLFVVRNVGNLIPPCDEVCGHGVSDESEAAAIEFAVLNLNVSNIIICGHSECGAMQALMHGRQNVQTSNLKMWLRHADCAMESYENESQNQNGNQNQNEKKFDGKLSAHNRLSQLNVLAQLEHLKSYPFIKERVESKKLGLHGWWFELANATVHCFDSKTGKFIEINEKTAERILQDSVL